MTVPHAVLHAVLLRVVKEVGHSSVVDGGHGAVPRGLRLSHQGLDHLLGVEQAVAGDGRADGNAAHDGRADPSDVVQGHNPVADVAALQADGGRQDCTVVDDLALPEWHCFWLGRSAAGPEHQHDPVSRVLERCLAELV